MDEENKMEKGLTCIFMGSVQLMLSKFSSTLLEFVMLPESSPKNYLSQLTTQMSSFVDNFSGIFSIIGVVMIFGGFINIWISLSGEDKYVKGAVGTIVSKKEKEKETTLINFQCVELNTIVEQIKEKILFLKNNEVLKGELEALLMIEQTEKTYLIKIFNDYMSIPKEKRNINTESGNPYNNTINQLKIILQGLSNIEDKIVSNSIMKQRANSIFLKQKVANI